MNEQTLVERCNAMAEGGRYASVNTWKATLSRAADRIEELESIVEGFIQYHNEGIGQLTHLLAAAEAAKEGATSK